MKGWGHMPSSWVVRGLGERDDWRKLVSAARSTSAQEDAARDKFIESQHEQGLIDMLVLQVACPLKELLLQSWPKTTAVCQVRFWNMLTDTL